MAHRLAVEFEVQITANTVAGITYVPEPSIALLLMTGLLGLASYRRGRMRG